MIAGLAQGDVQTVYPSVRSEEHSSLTLACLLFKLLQAEKPSFPGSFFLREERGKGGGQGFLQGESAKDET